MEAPLFIVMVAARSVLLSRRGTKVIVFGVSDKTDYLIIPVVLFFFYGIAATAVNLPFPGILKQRFWEIPAAALGAIIICTLSLLWFALTLRAFGKSFRVGIDETTSDKLVTTGAFALSRNPLYAAFIAFFLGLFLAYATLVSAVFLVLVSITIHRQILREESFLKTHYGSEYAAYCKKVRRYL